MDSTRQAVRSYPRRLDWLRYICAFLLYMYGASKLAHMQFSLGPAIAHRPVGSLTGYELTWYYYGYSRAYACILGSTQVAGATLLLFRKTAFLGAALMTPVMANILLINIFILVSDYGPDVMATIILTSLLMILWSGRARLLSVFLDEQPTESMEHRKMHILIRAMIVVTVLVAIGAGVYLKQRT